MNNETDLSLYKPNPSVAKTFSVDETLPDPELTFDIFKKLVLARKTQDLVFLSIGKMLKIVRDRKLYKHLDFDNFSQFLASEEIDFSREKAYMYIRIYDMYVDQLALDPDRVAKIGVVRLSMLTPIIKDLSREEAIEKIEEMGSRDVRYSDFVRTVKEQTNKTGKPTVYWSDEINKWVVKYYEDITTMTSLGHFNHEQH